MTRVYIDTGIFIDHLSGRGIGSAGLRTAGRRGRSLEQVLDDAERVLDRVAQRHVGATSALTYYEVEEALYKSITATTVGIPHAEVYRVAAARSMVPQTAITIQLFDIKVLDLTAETVDAQLRMSELQARGIRAADALHVASASGWNAEMILTADRAMLRLDNVITNHAGTPIRCCDSDDALSQL